MFSPQKDKLKHNYGEVDTPDAYDVGAHQQYIGSVLKLKEDMVNSMLVTWLRICCHFSFCEYYSEIDMMG
jgi:hypothetical protein